MADVKARKTPPPINRPHVRFGFDGYGFNSAGAARTNGLGVGVVTANTQVNYEVVPLFGMSTVSVRLKVTNTGTLDFFAVGPDFNPVQGTQDNTVFASLVGTIYTTGAPAQVPILANTEAIITFTGKGEGFGIVKFTGTAAGVITYCDVSYFHQSL